MNDTVESRTPDKVIAGSKVVFAMFGLGFLITGMLYLYWSLHTAPFLPLQQAIADEFEDSRPRVEGGQKKKHQETPPILRVVMKVDFDPNDSQRSEEIETLFNRLAELASDKLTETFRPFDDYETFEVHFYYSLPEQKRRELAVSRDVSELLK